MRTRELEAKRVVRACVTEARPLRVEERAVELQTLATVATKEVISSADSEMVNQAVKDTIGEQVTGTCRIDVVTDHVIRVRYAEGQSVPTNDTPMVVGPSQGPTKVEIVQGGEALRVEGEPAPFTAEGQQTDDEPAPAPIQITTADLRVLVSLKPLRIEVRDRDGQRLCGMGGPEKDNFRNWDSYNTGICRPPKTGDPIAVENFDLRHDECIYGLGEKFIKLDKTGQTIDLNMVDALGVTTPRSYKNIPFYVSNRGYGVFFNHSSRMTYWVGSLSAVDVQVAAEDDFLDYYVIAGSIKQVLARYTDLTGKGTVPPKWTFGYWQSKISYKSAQETLEIARQMREHEVPCDVIHLDTHWFKADWYCNLEFDKERFPDPEAYLKELADLGIKVSLWQLPYIPEGSKLFDDLAAVDGFVKNREGGIFDCGICFTPGFKGTVGVVDYTNPEAVRVHQEAFARLFRMGAKVIKTDFGEAAPVDGVYHDGTPGHRMHNLYPLRYNRAVFEVTKRETGDGVVWARSAWAGNQRFPLHWGGDNSPNYANMLPQLEGGLSFGMSGFQFWSQDIGGFCGTVNYPLLIRWMQLGMFISHSRIHGFGDREIYKYDKDTMRICRDYIRLRYRLMPYIYGQAMRCVDTSLPMARPLVVEFQDDPTVWNLSDEYLFGDGLLVAPIFDDTGSRRVYLPEGRWTDWWTHERYDGRQWIDVEADIETIPLYLREGAIVPMGPVMNYVEEKRVRKIELLVSVFEDDGKATLDVPVNDEVVPVEYRCRHGSHTVKIGPSSAKFQVKPVGKSGVRIKVREQPM